MKLNVAAGLIMLVILLTGISADVSAQPGKKKGHYKGKSYQNARYDKHPNHKRGHDKHYHAPTPQPARTTVIYAPAPAPRPGAVVVPVPVPVPPHPSNLPLPPLPPHPGLPRR